jgi:hypothetical protein
MGKGAELGKGLSKDSEKATVVDSVGTRIIPR